MSDEELRTDGRRARATQTPAQDGAQLFSAPELRADSAAPPNKPPETRKGVSAEALYRRGSILPPSAGEKRESAIGESAQFAPPPKFNYRVPGEAQSAPVKPEGEFAAPAKLSYTREPIFHTENTAPLPSGMRQPHYDVAEEPPRPKVKKKRNIKRIVLIALIAALVLGGAAYLLREPISAYLTQWTGQDAAQEAAQARVAYDPAVAIKPGEKVLSAIDRLTGGLALEPYAVTKDAIVRRMAREDGRYDYYLFSAEGLLLGYYENLPVGGFQVLDNGAFYVAESPYLITSAGLPLVHPESYRVYTDGEPVIGPLQHGWAVVSDPERTTFNYINEAGDLLSSVWFARAIPFRGSRTVAYVDTGDLQNPDERYTLYLLDDKGGMQMLERAAHMDGVTDVACDVMLRSTGALYALDDPETPLGVVSDVTAYLDVDIVVARDAATGLCGLYSGGVLTYEFTYDSIEPVACKLTWAAKGTKPFVLRAVEGAAYPQPLAHYFLLTTGEKSDTVAFATDSVCPICCE